MATDLQWKIRACGRQTKETCENLRKRALGEKRLRIAAVIALHFRQAQLTLIKAVKYCYDCVNVTITTKQV